MAKWEYRIVPFQGIAGFEGVANELNIMGESGWELVSLHSDRGELVGTFKRPRTTAVTTERAVTTDRSLTMERERETRRRGAA